MSHILPRKTGLFRYSPWDAVPVVFGVIHLFYLVSMFVVFTYLPLGWEYKAPLMALMGIAYAYSISWNINGISHNFIHNRYFNSSILNRMMSILISMDCCFSQVIYDYIHRRHHIGNGDKRGESGDTIDWISIYRHGEGGHAENVWKYTFGSFFREEPMKAYREIKKSDAVEARWGLFEMGLTGAMFVGGFALNWKFMLFFLPCWYLGHCLSYLNGYFEHFGGNPDVPMAWGVSSYHKLYNWVWFNNGYHAEHHYRPRAHWTRMKDLREQILEDQRRVGVRVIKPPHAFGFLDPDLCDEPLVPAAKLKTAEIHETAPHLADTNSGIVAADSSR
jgi:fatty acid desaturase